MASLQSLLYATSQASGSCLENADNVFGPIISRACLRDFDFTLLFEQGVLSIGPSALLLLFFPIRIWSLYGASKKVGPNYMRALKILTTTIYAALQLTILVFWLLGDFRTRATIPAAILSLTASLAICFLSYIEHVRSVRPSTLLGIYLFVSLIFDTFQARTLFLRHASVPLVWTFTAGLIVKFVLFILESREKAAILKGPFNTLSPEEISGVFNRTFIWWINPLIIDGYKRLLSVEDLPKISSEFSSKPLRQKLQKAWDQRPKPEGRYTLLLVSLKCLSWTIAAGLPLRVLLIALSYSQPYIINRAIRFIGEPVTEASKNLGVELILGAFVIYVGIAIVTMLYKMNIARLETQYRAQMVGLIHNRSLTLQDGHYDESAAVTLMSVDTDIITSCLSMLFDAWAVVLELFVGISLLALQVGWACMMPIVLVMLVSQISAYVGKNVSSKQKVWSQATQKRIAKTSSMLGSMKALKMMGLSELVESSIEDQRTEEIHAAKDFRWMVVYFNIAANSVSIFAPVVTFAAFTVKALWQGRTTLSTEQAFTSLALIQMVSGPSTQLLALVPMWASLLAACDRIQKFLLDPSREDKRLSGIEDLAKPKAQKYLDEEPYSDVEPQNGNGNGVVNGDDVVKSNGKNHALGQPQSDWAISIESATVRPAKTAEPALIDISMKVKKATMCLIAGPVGCGKSTLSRAILGELPSDSGKVEISSKKIGYCAQSAWLLNGTIRHNICGPVDDEEIDEVWYQSVLNACALERDLSLLPDGDRSLIGSRGLVLSGGQRQRVALARAIYARLDIVLLDDVLSALDAKTERLVVERLLGPEGLLRKLESTVLLITHATQYFHLADHIVIIGTDKKIEEQGTFEDLRSQEGYISKILLSHAGDGKKPDEEEHRMTTDKKAAKDTAADAAADLTRKTGDSAVYGYWLQSIGWKVATIFLLAETSFAFFLTFPQYWLKWWTEDNGGHMIRYMGGYFFLSSCALFSNVSVIAIMLIIIAPKTSASLHKILLHKVMRAPQAFFAETDTGVTLNRFSQDMNSVDRTLPLTGMIVFMQGFKIIAQGILLFSAQSFMVTTVPFVVLIMYFIQRIYLQTSRQMRFMELETQAPVYSHFLETLEGLATLRAFGWEKQTSAINTKRLDTSLAPYYLLFVIQRWLNLVLDLLVAALAVLVVILAVKLKNTTTGAQIGIALNVVLVFNMTLLRLAESYTQMETALGAISRLKNFEEQTATEDKPGEDFIPEDQWPSKGEIEFRDVTASYGPDALALRNISMTIAAGQKIGICGRTGSGKSSLLSTLLRLLDMDSGTIIIDGLDLQVLPREIIRTHMIAIPQDPFILSESVRMNADPGKTVSDEKIIEVLTKVNLWSVIEPRGGLDENMKKQPLSHGQQQLFCLARAMLRTSKILILDEATSNVDRETDKLMQRIIREEFNEHTIITVAHRLDTIVDSDMVAVLDAGALVEYGNPKELLAKESLFKDLHGH